MRVRFASGKRAIRWARDAQRDITRRVTSLTHSHRSSLLLLLTRFTSTLTSTEYTYSTNERASERERERERERAKIHSHQLRLASSLELICYASLRWSARVKAASTVSQLDLEASRKPFFSLLSAMAFSLHPSFLSLSLSLPSSLSHPSSL